MFENLNFGKTGFKTSVFEKHFISYSCILFITYYALRSFYIILLCFSKNWFFQNFDRSNLFLNRSKLQLNFGLALCVSIAVGSIESDFQSIEPNFWSIENRTKSFLKLWVFTCSITFKLFQNLFSLSLWSVKDRKSVV